MSDNVPLPPSGVSAETQEQPGGEQRQVVLALNAPEFRAAIVDAFLSLMTVGLDFGIPVHIRNVNASASSLPVSATGTVSYNTGQYREAGIPPGDPVPSIYLSDWGNVRRLVQ